MCLCIDRTGHLEVLRFRTSYLTLLENELVLDKLSVRLVLEYDLSVKLLCLWRPLRNARSSVVARSSRTLAVRATLEPRE